MSDDFLAGFIMGFLVSILFVVLVMNIIAFRAIKKVLREDD